MIDEFSTFLCFGYYSDDLYHGSYKPICVLCDICGKGRIVRLYSYRDLCRSCASKKLKHSKETREKMSKNHSGKNNPMYGIRICGENHHMFGKYGKDNPNWNPDITDEERQLNRKYPEYTEWRKSIFERDNYTCQICNDNKGGNLNAHHFESYTNNSELRTTLSNGITLCKTCHMNFHHQYGYGNNTKQQFIEFIGSN